MGPMSPFRRANELVRAHLGKRFLFYGMVSVAGTSITQVLLIVLHGIIGVRAWAANVVAVAVATPVSYYLNRAWVWGKRGKSHLTKEVIPFWAFSFGGLVLSTILVEIVASYQGVPHGHTPTARQQVMINAANFFGFAVLWLAQFFVLDKISFKQLGGPTSDSDVDEFDDVDAAVGGPVGTGH